jgi:DNA-directed RNA polymerase specialized sigma24 family protein
MQLFASIPVSKSHEEFFLCHYKLLLTRALALSHGHHEQAKDLVHDLYIRLLQTRPTIDLREEDPACGYLYTMLRNLSVSKARQAGRDALSILLIVDYEKMEYSLGCIDSSRLILVRGDLARVCEYACIRRHSSRCASILILRFFFDYYPSEIVRILRITRVAVEKYLQVARLEARTYLADPRKLRFLRGAVSPTFSRYLPDEPFAAFAELRARIFSGIRSDCVLGGTEASDTEPKPSLNVQELAHLVSCPECLDRTNLALGLPALAERFPLDSSTGRWKRSFAIRSRRSPIGEQKS